MTQTPSPSLTIDEPLTQQSTPKAKDYKRISDLYDPEELWNERDENDENEKTKKPKVGLSVEPELPTPWHRLFYKKSCDNNAEGLQDPDPEVRARAEKTVLRHVEWVTDLRRSRLTGEPTTMDKAWDQLADRWEDIKAKKIRPLIAEIQKEQTLIKKLIKKYDPKRINRKYERKFKRRALEESELRRVQRRGMMRAIELAYLRNPWEFPLLSEGDVKWYEGPLSQWRKKPSSPMREQRKKAAMLELVEWLQSGKHLQTKDIKGGQKQNNGGGKEPDGTHLEKKRDGKGKFSV
ncbi:unnamed protein product [Amoebophrya sp. A25]|nr:unnamed protein product [Amoebophrya sp. A25]|eukprot:GSA25T00020190001.1